MTYFYIARRYDMFLRFLVSKSWRLNVLGIQIPSPYVVELSNLVVHIFRRVLSHSRLHYHLETGFVSHDVGNLCTLILIAYLHGIMQYYF